MNEKLQVEEKHKEMVKEDQKTSTRSIKVQAVSNAIVETRKKERSKDNNEENGKVQQEGRRNPTS